MRKCLKNEMRKGLISLDHKEKGRGKGASEIHKEIPPKTDLVSHGCNGSA